MTSLILRVDPTVGARFHFQGRTFSVRAESAPKDAPHVLISVTVERMADDLPGLAWLLGVEWPDDTRLTQALALEGSHFAFVEAGEREGQAIYAEIRT